MRWLIVIAALAASLVLASGGAARTAHATMFPSAGVVVPGQSIGGITIGMTQAQVKAAWGPTYMVCPESACGPQLTWLYEYAGQDAALGAAVKFSTPASATTTGSSSAALAKKAGSDELLAAKASSAATVAEAKVKTAQAAEATASKKAGTTAAKLAALKAAVTAAEAKAATAKAAATKATAVYKAAEQAAKAAASSSSASASTSGGVVAVFTLGSPVGWGIKGQIMMGDPVSNVYSVFGNPATANCIGYSALTVRIGNNTTSFYSSSGVIYGFALTAASQSPCE